MKKAYIIFIVILLFSCKTNQPVYEYAEIIPIYRPNYQKIPKNDEYKIVDFFFSKWAESSNQILEDEFSQLDSLEKMAYHTYESLFLDTTYIGFNINKVSAKYIIVPNSIIVGTADSIYGKYYEAFYHNLKKKRINNFRPRISLENTQPLYYTGDYKKQLPIIADKLGVGSFIHLSGFLRSGHPAFLETSPLIREIIYNKKKTNEACIKYEDRNEIYKTLIKEVNGKWIKVKDLEVMTRD